MTTNGKSVDKEVARCIENKKDFSIEIMLHEKYEQKKKGKSWNEWKTFLKYEIRKRVPDTIWEMVEI